MPQLVRFLSRSLPGDPTRLTCIYTSIHTGGNTNITYRVDLASNQQQQPPQSFILRIFGQGTEALIDRGLEAKCFHLVAARGLGPRLLGDFRGGRIEEYIYGEVRESRNE